MVIKRTKDMGRRALLLFAIAAIYVVIRRNEQKAWTRKTDHAADAQLANEGGANSPPSV
jgi:hypothetical protein